MADRSSVAHLLERERAAGSPLLSSQRRERHASTQTDSSDNSLTNEAIIRRTQALISSLPPEAFKDGASIDAYINEDGDRVAASGVDGDAEVIEIADEDDEADAFEPVTLKRRRSPAPPTQSKRVRTSISPQAPSQVSAGSGATGPQLPTPPAETGPNDVDVAALRHLALATTRATRRRDRYQPRVPWSDRDVQTLIQAVSLYGARWSIIAELARDGTLPFELVRDQQAFRDKARAVKQDTLK